MFKGNISWNNDSLFNANIALKKKIPFKFVFWLENNEIPASPTNWNVGEG